MKSTLFIPKTLKVGFQSRSDTFTGKLAYVTYFDEKSKLRKETSWASWRDKGIEPLEIENKPVAGFVLNKGVQRDGYWGSGRSVIRVHDPREFEFEISVDNLIGLLMHSDVTKRDIVEQCVFAWAGTELVLLPVNSEAFQSSLAFTKKQDQKVSAKSLVKGRQYQWKKSEGLLTYIGYFEWYAFEATSERVSSSGAYWGNQWYFHKRKQVFKGKRHVFYDGKRFETPAVTTLSGEVSEDIVGNYAELVEEFFKTTDSQPIIGVTCRPVESEALMVSAYGRDRVSRVIETAGRIETLTLPTRRYDNPLRKLHRDPAVAEFTLSRESRHFTTTPEFTTTYTSGGDTPLVFPFDATGVRADAFGPSDFEDVKRPEGSSAMRISAKFMGLLREQGYGSLFYVLANGQLCPGL